MADLTSRINNRNTHGRISNNSSKEEEEQQQQAQQQQLIHNKQPKGPIKYGYKLP